jgi:hypothetical protein
VLTDNLTEVLLYLLYQAAARAGMIPLDQALRPKWLFGRRYTRLAIAGATASKQWNRNRAVQAYCGALRGQDLGGV